MDNTTPNNNNNFGNIGTPNSTNTSYSSYPPEVEENENVIKFRQNYPFVIIVTLIYALLYTFSLYHNPAGITGIIYGAATFAYLLIIMKKVEIVPKNDYIGFGIVFVALGLNLSFTASQCFIIMDHILIIILALLFLIHNVYEDSKWRILKYTVSVITSLFLYITNLFSPISDLVKFRKNKDYESKTSGNTKYIIIGLCIALPLLLIIVPLLGSANILFANFIESIFDNFEFFWNNNNALFEIIMRILLTLVFVYGMCRTILQHSINEEVDENRISNPTIALTVNISLLVVYVIFTLCQIMMLFNSNFSIPEDYTYAEYAREGFFELVIVCLINMAVVLICQRRFANNKTLNIILTAMCGCTYILLLSSVIKMVMYIQAYQLTFLRVFVFWALIVIFFTITGILISIYKTDFPIFKYFVVSFLALYIVFAYSRPDYFIAKNNLSTRFTSQDYSKIDFDYLMRSSADAVPAIIDAIERENDTNFLHGFNSYDSEQILFTLRNMTDIPISYYYGTFGDDDFHPISSTKTFSNIRVFNFSVNYARQRIIDFRS